MVGYGILMIVFGLLTMIAGVYLVKGKKGDFSSVLLWKSDVNRMSVEEVKYAGKVTIATSLAPILSGIVAFLSSENSIIPYIVLGVSLVVFLVLSIKFFK